MPAPTASTLRITLPSDTAYLHLVTNFARNAARAAGLSEADAEKLALATDEAVTNVIEHAYRGRPGRPIEVLAEIGADGVAIRVIHDGEPIDPASIPTDVDPGAMLRQRRRGGMGVILMKRLVDRVDYRPTEDRRSECCLWKDRDPGLKASRTEG